jgi:hypothetical protein
MEAGDLVASAFPSWGNAGIDHVWSHNRTTDQLRRGQTELQTLNKPVFIRTLFQVNEHAVSFETSAIWGNLTWYSCCFMHHLSSRTQRHAVRFKSTKVSEEHVAFTFRLTNGWSKKSAWNRQQQNRVEDGGDVFLRNVSSFSLGYTSLRARRYNYP